MVENNTVGTPLPNPENQDLTFEDLNRCIQMAKERREVLLKSAQEEQNKIYLWEKSLKKRISDLGSLEQRLKNLEIETEVLRHTVERFERRIGPISGIVYNG